MMTVDRLDTLRAFVAVADALGFAPAARRLGWSAPAVTRAIAALEKRLGTQLLHRTTRAVRLTEAGAHFLADCRRILAELDEAEAAAGGAQREPRGQLSVTAPAMFGRLHLAPIVLEFLARTPAVGARTFFVDRLVNLVEEGFDVALRIAHLPDSGLAATPVGRLRRVVVASPAYLAAHGEPEAPADLARHHGIGFTFDGAAARPWVFRAARGKEDAAAQPRVRLVVNGSEVAVAAACAGLGLARALSYQVAAEVRAGRLRVVLEDHEPDPIPVHLVHAAGRRVAAKVRAFVAFAAERLRAEPVLGPDQASARIFA